MCQGIISLSRRFPVPRLEAACARARSHKLLNYRSVLSILERRLDEVPLEDGTAEPPATSPAHSNVRGHDYYR
jgi:hypothetical protein